MGLGACALGLAGAGLMTVSDGTASTSGMLLIGASLLSSAAAGFVAFRSRTAAATSDPTMSDPAVVRREVLALIGDAGDGVWDYDLRTQHIVYTPACATMLGYEADEITSTLSQWGTLVHEDDLPRARRALDDYLEGRSDHYRQLVRMRRKDGGWTRVLDCGRVLARDEQGRALRVCGVHRIAPETGNDAHGVAETLTSDLDQALAGLLGQATLAAAPGEGTELERAAWRCVGLANRLKLAGQAQTQTGSTRAETDVLAVTGRVVEDAEQWTPDRMVFRVRCDANVGTEVLCESTFRSLVALCIDDAVERVELAGGQVSLRLWRAPHLVLSIAASPARLATGDPTKRMEAIEGLAFRHGIAVTRTAGDLRVAWPAPRRS